MKTVYVLMPCYNSEKFLAESLNSVVNQTYHQWNLLVINDGSTDRSWEIIDNFRRCIPWQIFIFSGPNQGVCAARNFLRQQVLQKDDSDIIVLLDSDDVLQPRALERFMDVFEKNQTADVVYSNVIHRFSDGSPAFPYGMEQPPFQPPIYTGAVAFRKKCFSVGEFDGRVEGKEDWLMWIKMLSAGYIFYYHNEALMIHTVKTDGVASKWDKDKERIFKEEVEKYLK